MHTKLLLKELNIIKKKLDNREFDEAKEMLDNIIYELDLRVRKEGAT